MCVSDVGPGIRKLEGHEPSDRTIHFGDVLVTQEPASSITWIGKLDGTPATRTGPAIKAVRTPLDSPFYVFQSDVREGLPVADIDFLCSRLGNPTWFTAPCEQGLIRRWLPGNKTAAFVVCEEAQCPLVLAGPQGVSLTRITGLTELRAARFGRFTMLLATSQWSRGEGLTGHDLLVLSADAGLRRLAVIPIILADAGKGAVQRWQIASWTVTPAGIRVVGERASAETDTGKRLETTPFDDTWYVTLDGELYRQPTGG